MDISSVVDLLDDAPDPTHWLLEPLAAAVLVVVVLAVENRVAEGASSAGGDQP